MFISSVISLFLYNKFSLKFTGCREISKVFLPVPHQNSPYTLSQASGNFDPKQMFYHVKSRSIHNTFNLTTDKLTA